ncbi:MAG: hypothetical protein KBD07_03880, partial [Candidatus Omnitrophica bacterium]|nr:hypothetical protein [Candidatus Omnitrophota bacterium]
GKQRVNLSQSQVRSYVVDMLRRLSAVYEGARRNRRIIEPYLDVEGLSVANRAWLESLLKKPQYSRYKIIGPDNRIPNGMVINWYVKPDQKDYEPEPGFERIATQGPHTLLAQARPGIEHAWEKYLFDSFGFIAAILPGTSTMRTEAAAARFAAAASFSSPDVWMKLKRIFYDPKSFTDVDDLFQRVKGVVAYTLKQVAAYTRLSLSDWVQYQREMVRRASIAV